MKHVFITGATGVIGSALVPLFLAEPDTRLSLLLRAKSQSDLEGRVQELLRFWSINPRDRAYTDRIRALRGDVSEPFFALAREDYERLTREITHIVHAAANVKMTLPLEEARASAVTSVRLILELVEACARQGVLSKVEVVSTVGVAGRTRGLIPERPLTEVVTFHNTYEAAKAEAEKIVFGVWQEWPITVHRPSMVVGDSRTGKIMHFQVFYHLCEFLSGQPTAGLVLRAAEATLDIIPVDYVAQGIYWASGHAEVAGRILHLCSGPEDAIKIPVLMQQVRAFRRARGAKLPHLYPLPRACFRALLPVIARFTSPQVQRALRTLPLFLDYLDQPPMFSNAETKQLLTPAGITVPPVHTYLETILRYYDHARAASTRRAAASTEA